MSKQLDHCGSVWPWYLLGVAIFVASFCGCGLTAAFAGPRESVAVAVAVDKHLQTNTPKLPDQLGGEERREIQPGPAPKNVCPCGCGKVNCTCPHAQGIAAIGSKPCGVQTVAEAVRSRLDQRRGEDKGEDEGPVVSLNVGALEGVLETLRREVVVAVADPQAGDGRCVPCEQTVKALGIGDHAFRVTVIPRTQATFPVGALPTIHIPDAGVTQSGAVDVAGVKALLRASPPRIQSFGSPALNVGTIKGRDALRKLFTQVKQTKDGATFKFGPASVVIPPDMPNTINLTDQGCRVAFTGARPSFRVGSGWFSGGVYVTGLSVADNRIGVEIGGRELFTVSVE